MASELANKCRIAGEAVQSDLDAKPAPTGGISLFDSETYPEVQAVKEEFEKVSSPALRGGARADYEHRRNLTAPGSEVSIGGRTSSILALNRTSTSLC